MIEHSGITITPIAYGDVEDGELRDIAASRENTVYRDDPKRTLPLISDLIQATFGSGAYHRGTNPLLLSRLLLIAGWLSQMFLTAVVALVARFQYDPWGLSGDAAAIASKKPCG